MLTTAGFQVPETPSSEVCGSTGTLPFEHIVNEVPKSKVGVVLGVTVTVKLAGNAQMPEAGVNVYVPEIWLSTTAGFQVPGTPFVDVPGRTGAVALAHIVVDVPKLNTGVTFGLTATEKVTGVAHNPVLGVKV